MSLTEDQTIWFPGIYNGREGDYAKTLSEVTQVELLNLVQQRAQEDGEWAIDNGFVGDDEDKMRKMMAWVSDLDNINQCVDHINKEGLLDQRTVDFVCRDLANASKWIANRG